MPKSPTNHPLIYLAHENGWSWVLESPGKPLQSSASLAEQLTGSTSIRDAARNIWGLGDDSLPGEGDLNVSRSSESGHILYFLKDGTTRALIIRSMRATEETAELALSATHELANALSAISGWAQLGLDEPSKMRDALATVENAAASAQRVARDVLAFEGDGDKEPCDAAMVCRDVASLLHPIALRNQVRIHTDTPSLGWTRAHRAAVFRVVWNLALNATQIQSQGGVVRISCAKVNEEIRIRVVDEGPGIPKADQRRIFDAHFSARPGGTGLGLATVQRTLDRVDGRITLTSEEGLGTTFEVVLPRSFESDERVSGVVIGQLPQRLLVVEDDDGVRELIETTMGLRGIDVVAAIDRESALLVEGTFDVALADLTLPDGRGDTLLEELRRRGTARRTIITSGQLDPGTLVGPPDAWLPKPFDIHDLVAVLREVRRPGASASNG